MGNSGIGELVVNWGSMFSGKTEELLRSIRRSNIAGLRVKVIKPRIDDRYGRDSVVTHYGDSYECTEVGCLEDIKKMCWKDIDVVGIDEGQFFGEELMDMCRFLKYEGKKVIVSGLDMWSSGEPVVCMANVAAISNKVEKFNAVCVNTGKDAYISYSLGDKDEDVKVGGNESYIALCEEEYMRLENRRK